MWAPHPAAFAITTSTPAKAWRVRVARRLATASRPLCAGRAPQHAWPRGTVTRQPVRVSTRIVARFTSWNQRSCTQPDSRATVPRTATPAGGEDTLGSRANGVPPRGRTARARRGSSGRTIGWNIVAIRISDGCGRSQWNPSQWTKRVRRVRAGSTCSRAASIMRPNGTCDGQTSSQARQTRHRSMKSVNDESISAPSATARIAAIRPRGDADSSPVSR